MLDAPRNASRIDIHWAAPHWSMDTSLRAPPWPSRWNPVMPSDMRTVWVPAESYLWDWLPLTPSSTVPSPQSMVYVPRAGMVMDWPGAVVFQVVTKSEEGGKASGTSAMVRFMLSETVAAPSLTVSVRVRVVLASTWGVVKVVDTAVALSKAMAGLAGSWDHR